MCNKNFNLVLIHFCKTHFKRSRMEFSNRGLSHGQPKILDFLHANDGCIQKDIALKCKIEPATVTNILGIMEREGLIVRTPSQNDRRILNVWLTDKGKEEQKKVIEVFKTMKEVCLNGFSPKEEKLAINLLERMMNNMKNIGIEEENND